jgi:hypothetical protein
MTDPLPDDVRKDLESLANGPSVERYWAQQTLAKYPRSQPEPAWQPGDVVIDVGKAWLWDGNAWNSSDSLSGAVTSDAEPLFVNGRRVHPPRFANHAATLRWIAAMRGQHEEWSDDLRRIAADLADDVVDAEVVDE